MTELTKAIAELRRVTPPNSPWEAGDIGVGSSPVDYHIATILNAVISGDLIPKAEIEKALSDPTSVHYSMLKGTIAKPTLAQIIHLYGGDLIPRADAELATLRAQVEKLNEWRDVVSWVDDGEKTFFAWSAGGAAPGGEFSRIGLRRITADGREVFRSYTADGPWVPPALTEGAAP